MGGTLYIIEHYLKKDKQGSVAVWQAGQLLLVVTSCAGMAFFLGCICFLQVNC